jgi:hypothetical protein
MTFQKTVRFDQAGGIPGEFMNVGPTRAESGIAKTVVAVGTAVSEDPAAPGFWQQGLIAGALRFGIVTTPKQYAARGTQAGGTLAPTMALPANSEIEVCTMGHIWASSTTASSQPGWVVQFDNTTGVLSAKAAGPADAGNTLLPNTKVAPLPGAATTPNMIGVVLTN